MAVTTTIRVVAAGLVAAGALSPVALAGGEPKNDWPFTRSVADRTPAEVQRAGSQARVGLGEPKNERPFTRPIVAGANAETASRATFSSLVSGEPKNDQPFTQQAIAPTVLVRSSGGFDWADAGIGLAAGVGLAAVVTGGLLLAYRGPRSRKIGAAAVR
jgi:hypothetical protein